jgi:hypothetical protein
LAALDNPGQADLILEWSAPAGLDLADEEGWRMASPYWTPERERMIRAALDRALDASVDVGGQDARAGFQTQWLCRWPTEDAGARKGEPLLPEGLWDSLRTDQDCCGTHWTVAVEDHYGQGGAVAGCGELADGSWLLWGEEFDSRAQAFAKAVELIDDLPRVDVIVGATLLGDPDVRDLSHHVIGQTGAQTRQALPLLRELAREGRIHWDPSDGHGLTAPVERAFVVERQIGLVLVGPERTDLVRAASWALLAQAQPKPVPAIY